MERTPVFKEYENFRFANGVSEKTTRIEISDIKSLLSFLNQKHKKKLEYYEITSKDIHDFLDDQKKKGLKNSTILRKLKAIRYWFDYLWRTNQIPYDFMPKFDKKDLNITPSIITVNYNYLLDKKDMILSSADLRNYTKLIFLFYMRGFRIRDMVRITLDDIYDNKSEIVVKKQKDNGCTQIAIFSDTEIPILLTGIEDAIFKGTPYLLSSKIDGEYVPLQFGSLKNHLEALKLKLNMPFRSEEIRLAYTHYLYVEQKKSVEEIQKILGLPLSSASKIIKETLERVKPVDYNERNNGKILYENGNTPQFS